MDDLDEDDSGYVDYRPGWTAKRVRCEGRNADGSRCRQTITLFYDGVPYCRMHKPKESQS